MPAFDNVILVCLFDNLYCCWLLKQTTDNEISKKSIAIRQLLNQSAISHLYD